MTRIVLAMNARQLVTLVDLNKGWQRAVRPLASRLRKGVLTPRERQAQPKVLPRVRGVESVVRIVLG